MTTFDSPRRIEYPAVDGSPFLFGFLALLPMTSFDSAVKDGSLF
jgi:hypothetical protein